MRCRLTQRKKDRAVDTEEKRKEEKNGQATGEPGDAEYEKIKERQLEKRGVAEKGRGTRREQTERT